MEQVKRRRIQIRDTNGEVGESLDSKFLQALASHRREQVEQKIPADSVNASTATVQGKRTIVAVPDALSGARVCLHTVLIEIDRDIQTRNFVLGSLVRKVVQGGAAGNSFNNMHPTYTEDNAYRIMESRASQPFPFSVVDIGNYSGLIRAAVQVLIAHMPTVDVQVWAYEFASFMIEQSPLQTASTLGPWCVHAACEAFARDADHYRGNPINSLADLVIVEFCHQIRYGDAGPPIS